MDTNIALSASGQLCGFLGIQAQKNSYSAAASRNRPKFVVCLGAYGLEPD